MLTQRAGARACAGQQHHPISVATWHFIIPSTKGPMSTANPRSLAGIVHAHYEAQRSPRGGPPSVLETDAATSAATPVTRSTAAAAAAAAEASSEDAPEGAQPAEPSLARSRRSQKEGPWSTSAPWHTDGGSTGPVLAVEDANDEPMTPSGRCCSWHSRLRPIVWAACGRVNNSLAFNKWRCLLCSMPGAHALPAVNLAKAMHKGGPYGHGPLPCAASNPLLRLLFRCRVRAASFLAAPSIYESRCHLLHGVLHQNGFGHLLRVNGMLNIPICPTSTSPGPSLLACPCLNSPAALHTTHQW